VESKTLHAKILMMSKFIEGWSKADFLSHTQRNFNQSYGLNLLKPT